MKFDWISAFELIAGAAILIGVPCVFTAIYGSKIINDLGNFPTKSALIQMKASWIILLVQIVSFLLLLGFFNVIS